MPKPYPKEFREGCLHTWMKKADVEDGHRPGRSDGDRAELREAKKRVRLLEQENEVLRGQLPTFPRRACRENSLPARP